MEYNIEWHELLGGLGTAYSVSSEPPDYDVISELHKTVREVTGYDPAPPQRRIGFY